MSSAQELDTTRSVSLGVRLLTNHIILQTILTLTSSPVTIIRLSWTCRAVRNIVEWYVQHTFDINRHLSRYFPDPKAFRSVQARTATLIGGSNALQFLDRTVYENADLDLY